MNLVRKSIAVTCKPPGKNENEERKERLYEKKKREDRRHRT